MRPFFPCLLIVAVTVVTGCDSPETTTTATNASGTPGENVTSTETTPTPATISLEPADLEKLASWEETSQASAQLTEQLAGIMAEIEDTESAQAAIPKLKDLALRFAAINRAEKQFGEPSKEVQSLVLKNLAAANKLFDQAYTPLIENDELSKIVGQAIDDAYVGNVSEE